MQLQFTWRNHGIIHLHERGRQQNVIKLVIPRFSLLNFYLSPWFPIQPVINFLSQSKSIVSDHLLSLAMAQYYQIVGQGQSLTLEDLQRYCPSLSLDGIILNQDGQQYARQQQAEPSNDIIVSEGVQSQLVVSDGLQYQQQYIIRHEPPPPPPPPRPDFQQQQNQQQQQHQQHQQQQLQHRQVYYTSDLPVDAQVVLQQAQQIIDASMMQQQQQSSPQRPQHLVSPAHVLSQPTVIHPAQQPPPQPPPSTPTQQHAAQHVQQHTPQQHVQQQHQSTRIITPQGTIVTHNQPGHQMAQQQTSVPQSQNGPMPQQNVQQRASPHPQQVQQVVAQTNAGDMDDLEESITAAIVQKHQPPPTDMTPQQFHSPSPAMRPNLPTTSQGLSFNTQHYQQMTYEQHAQHPQTLTQLLMEPDPDEERQVVTLNTGQRITLAEFKRESGRQTLVRSKEQPRPVQRKATKRKPRALQSRQQKLNPRKC
ncbi:Uncharacterized protein OBRU01_11422 [Operophtera brumata]|uniref:Uncharacterized protein n=1 Tax=Operophtera brumata TaxID=104452 RepID=A0A0L7LCA5_OPEBR|nr:Uncharacterized protein OBRU01_11422 [Operophtera brumata]